MILRKGVPIMCTSCVNSQEIYLCFFWSGSFGVEFGACLLMTSPTNWSRLRKSKFELDNFLLRISPSINPSRTLLILFSFFKILSWSWKSKISLIWFWSFSPYSFLFSYYGSWFAMVLVDSRVQEGPVVWVVLKQIEGTQRR